MALQGYPLTYDYGDAGAEARRCRADCALFDFSFLECARLEGAGAQGLIEQLTSRSLASLGENEIFYALRADASGGLIADWTVWRTGQNAFEVMSGRREDIEDLLTQSGSQLKITDQADRSVFAVQGPGSLDALRKLGDVANIARLKYFTFAQAELAGMACTVGRLGYTGEAGFEIITARQNGAALWQALAAQIVPAGFIAADILRIEAGFVLFTQEFALPVTPREIGLGQFGGAGERRRPEITLVSFTAKAEGLSWPWRPASNLARPSPGTITVTSACASVVAGGILGLGYVIAGTAPNAALHDPVGTFREIRLASRPFYDPQKLRPRAPWR